MSHTTQVTITRVVRLDTLRSMCALYVVAHHLFRNIQGIGVLFSFGQEAVIVFFLLSGRVIRISESNNPKTTIKFYLNRINRIMPPLLAAMSISYLLLVLGMTNTEYKTSEFIATLFCLQDISALKPGVIANPFLGNSPLWSLSYEMFFYFTFPIIRFIQGKYSKTPQAIPCILSIFGIISYLLIPNHFSLVSAYLVVWWMGYYSYEIMDKSRSSRSFIWTILLINIILYYYCVRTNSFDLGISPALILRHFIFALLTLLMSGNLRLKNLTIYTITKFALLSNLSSFSYGIYILHYPILIQWQSSNILIFCSHILVCIGASYFVESKSLNPIYLLRIR